jgi:hypothetical protein
MINFLFALFYGSTVLLLFHIKLISTKVKVSDIICIGLTQRNEKKKNMLILIEGKLFNQLHNHEILQEKDVNV